MSRCGLNHLIYAIKLARKLLLSIIALLSAPPPVLLTVDAISGLGFPTSPSSPSLQR
ncbi:hypothetical protein PENSPDRAFT_656610 [Peniophora sp. CONT]|nr:hypothetical protein PENSPDRAFT_656610 [Peniophora sp. CONT]